jgi:hypothetical protein
MGGLVHELKELLAENFCVSHAIYAPRECNRVAHELAVIGEFVKRLSLMAGVPNCIQYLVSSDFGRHG